MNKLYSILFLLSSSFGFSQAVAGTYVTLGGGTKTLQSNDLLSNTGQDFRIGFANHFGFHETYNYQVEIIYSHANINLLTVDQNLNPGPDKKFNLPSIEIGAYFNYYILKPEEDTFFLGLQAGPYFSYTGVDESFSSENTELYLPYLVDDADLTNFSKTNFGVGVGLTGGYNSFRFDLRYTRGLNNPIGGIVTNDPNNPNPTSFPKPTGNLSGIFFSVSYRILSLFGG